MTIAEMLGQSGILTVLGMCVVFAFLIILIGAMNVLHVVIHALKLDVEKKDTSSVSAGSANATVAQDQKSIVAAIAAAIHNKQ
ncbi:MAG: OadG family protein [Treponema sp.]|nr:OadG family protein [Treponema sp.]